MKFNGDRMQSILSEYLQAVKRLGELAALKIDNKKVFFILQENLPDLHQFIDELKARLLTIL